MNNGKGVGGLLPSQYNWSMIDDFIQINWNSSGDSEELRA